jgi:hypothetical protein
MKETLAINRQLAPGEYRLSDLCGDIGTCEILQEVFSDAGEFQAVLAHTRVIVTDASRPREMCVDNDDGSILIGLAHLRSAPEVFLHLDIIHELCHVKQHFQGRDLYDQSLAYVDRPTEIEAYAVTVREARRIGLTEDQIANYLRVSWITPEEYRRFLRRLAVAGDFQADRE